MIAGTTTAQTGSIATLAGLARHGLGQARAILAARTERDRMRRDALAAFAIRIGSAALLYLSQVVLARWIGTDGYGVYVVVWTAVLVLGGLSTLGLNQAVIRLIPEYRERGDAALLKGLLGASRLAAFATGTLAAALGLLGIWLIGPALSEPYLLPAYLALVCVPMYAVTDVQDGIGRGRSWMGLGLLPPYLLRPLIVLLAMALAHAGGLEMSASTAVGAAIVATWAAGLLQLAMLQHKLAPERTGDPVRTDWRTWLSISLPLMAITAAEIALQSADVLILSWSVSSGEIAIYYAAAKTMSLILYVHYAVGSAVAHRLSALSARADAAELKRAVSEAVRYTFWPSLAAAAAILALGQPLLWLFGPQFTSGYPVMLILVLGFLARSAVGPSDVILRMLGQHRISAVISGGTALLNIVLLTLLIPVFGLIGAAIATALALTVEAACNWTAARRRLDLDIAIWQVR